LTVVLAGSPAHFYWLDEIIICEDVKTCRRPPFQLRRIVLAMHGWLGWGCRVLGTSTS
jgi:hypothetical protein